MAAVRHHCVKIAAAYVATIQACAPYRRRPIGEYSVQDDRTSEPANVLESTKQRINVQLCCARFVVGELIQAVDRVTGFNDVAALAEGEVTERRLPWR